MSLRALVRHRLTHFVLIGGLAWIAAPGRRAGRDVTLPAAQVDAMLRAEARRRGIPLEALDAASRKETIARIVEDELLYREGLRLGLDQDDPIVRGRVIQKLLFHAEDAYGASAPITDAEVRDFWASDRERWRSPTTLDLEHVYVAGSDAAARAKAKAVRARLVAEAGADPMSLGDAFPLSRRMQAKTSLEIAAQLGESIAEASLTQPVATWSEPLESSYGLHLVRVTKRTPGALLGFQEAEHDVRAALRSKRKRDATAALLARLQREYRVVVEGTSGPVGASSLERVAARTVD